PPVSTTSCTTLPRKHVPPGKPPSAGTPPGPTSSQSGGSPKFDRSEHRASRIAWICSGRVGFRSTPSALLRDAVFLRGVLDSEDRVDADSGVDGEHGRGSQACPENAPSAECPAPTAHARISAATPPVRATSKAFAIGVRSLSWRLVDVSDCSLAAPP